MNNVPNEQTSNNQSRALSMDEVPDAILARWEDAG